MVQILFLAVVGALIGWYTNYLAVKLIFRPQNPWKIPLTRLEIQGLIPKRRAEIAKSIGETVANELVSIEEVLDRLIQSQNKAVIIQSIRNKILLIIEQRLPSILPSGIKTALLNYVSDVLDEEIVSFMDNSLKDVVHKAASSIDIGLMVEEKINCFNLNELEEMIHSISKRELKHIELLGGVLGFAIGLVQAIIIHII